MNVFKRAKSSMLSAYSAGEHARAEFIYIVFMIGHEHAQKD